MPAHLLPYESQITTLVGRFCACASVMIFSPAITTNANAITVRITFVYKSGFIFSPLMSSRITLFSVILLHCNAKLWLLNCRAPLVHTRRIPSHN